MSGGARVAPRLAVLLLSAGCRVHGASCPPSTQFAAPLPSTEPPLGPADLRVDPCVDFYAYACAPWAEATRLPSTLSMTSPAREAVDVIEQELRALLEHGTTTPSLGEVDTTLEGPRQAYARCMETEGDALATVVLPPELEAALGAVTDPETFLRAAGVLLRHGVPSVLEVELLPDLEAPHRGALYLDEAGVGLPEARMVVEEDPQAQAVREPYRARIEYALRLRGVPPDASAERATEVLAFEQRLAAARIPRTAAYERWHATQGTEDPQLQLYARTLGEALQLSDQTPVYYGSVDYLRALADMLEETGPETLRDYLRWHLARALARWQPEDPWPRDVEAILDGRSDPPPRWRRCVLKIYDEFEQLGPAIGERVFPRSRRATASAVVESVQDSLADRVRAAHWASAPLRQHALEKVTALRVRLGPGDEGPSRAGFVPTEHWLHDALQLGARDFERARAGAGAPLSAERWLLPAIATSAYYNWATNTVSVGLPRLHAPLYDPAMDPAGVLGTLGLAAGHEMGHAIGRLHIGADVQGHLTTGWAVAAVWDRSECVGDLHADLGTSLPMSDQARYDEAIADRIGLSAIEAAYRDGRGGDACILDRDDGLRLMYTSFAQSMCRMVRAERQQGDATDDEHAPQALRVNAAVSGRIEFRRAFECGPRSPLGRAPICEVW